MEIFKAEVKANFERGFDAMVVNASDVAASLNIHKDRFEQSYFRVVSLQAWRSELLSELLSQEAEAFFLEAHNDALMSHALARQGAWRVSLMSLRSLIENTVFGLYYCEHPVELALWGQGKHKLGFSETISYLERHPRLASLSPEVVGLDVIKDEYATLSKAVHGSAKSFRMTREGLITGLHISNAADFGSWLTREKMVIIAVNRLMLSFYREFLCGAAKPNLRKAISAVLPAARFAAIKSALGVTLRI